MAESERVEQRDIRSADVPLATERTRGVDMVAPIDRVRWGAVIAGFFAVLSTLAVLSSLGLAVGLSAFDVSDRLRDFGLGAGIWGIVSALIAFAVGGWLAARTAAVRGRANGLLNGAMVWVVTIPLLLYWLIGGVGALLGTASDAAMRTGQAAISTQGGAAQPGPSGGVTQPSTQAGQMVQQSAERVKAAASQVTPQNVENAAGKTAKGAWGLLASLLLGLAAAAVGGWIGARGIADYPATRTRTIAV